jgi:hypothetical protein
VLLSQEEEEVEEEYAADDADREYENEIEGGP